MQNIISVIKKQGVVSLLFLSVAIISFRTIMISRDNAGQKASMQQITHTFDVQLTTEKLLSYLKDAETGQRGFLLLRDAKYLAPYTNSKKQIAEAIEYLRKATINSPEQQKRLEDIDKLVALKYAELQETIDLRAKADDSIGLTRALEVVRSDKGKLYMDDLRSKLLEIVEAEKMLQNQYTTALVSRMRITNVMGWITGAVVVTILLLGIRTIRQQVKSRDRLFGEFDKRTREYLFDKGDNNSTLDEKIIVDNLIDNIKNAVSFIKHTQQQLYDHPYAGLTPENETLNTDNLAGALIEMRSQLKKVSEEERIRNWSTEGLARFSQVLRTDTENRGDLYFEVISSFTKYMNANQTALFILNEEDPDHPYLELVGCYAYERRKYQEKTIEIGEGLVGQIFLEKETVCISAVPKDYIKITSGLGEATPGCLLIVPLLRNDRVVGVIEMASLQSFAPHEIDFAKRLAQSLAASIIDKKTNERTQRLLMETQQKAEELRATEEEMRQNLEELAATQEEMKRKETEYLRRIQELERSN